MQWYSFIYVAPLVSEERRRRAKRREKRRAKREERSDIEKRKGEKREV